MDDNKDNKGNMGTCLMWNSSNLGKEKDWGETWYQYQYDINIQAYRKDFPMLQKLGPEIVGTNTFKISFKSKEKCPAWKFCITIEQTTNRGYEFSTFGSC